MKESKDIRIGVYFFLRRYFAWGDKMGIPRLIFSAGLLLGPAFVLALPYVLIKIEDAHELPLRTLLSFAFVLIWVWFGPYVIVSFSEAQEIFLGKLRCSSSVTEENCNKLRSLQFTKPKVTNLLCVLFTITTSFAITSDLSYFSRFGLDSYSDAYFIIMMPFIAILLMLNFFPFIEVLICIRLVNSIIKNDMLKIDITRRDHFSDLKKLIKQTTFFISTGFMFFPLTLDYTTFVESITIKTFIYCLIVIYLVFVFGSFYFPMIKLSEYAKKQTAKSLDHYRNRYNQIINVSVNKGYSNLVEQLEAMNLFNYINSVVRTPVYEVKYDVLLQLLKTLLVLASSYLLNSQDIKELVLELTSRLTNR